MPNGIQREHAVNFFFAALKAADPYAAVVRHAGEVRRVMHEKGCKRILIVGCGKAVVAMARAAVTELKDYVYDGAIITKYNHVPDKLALHPIEINEASHPLPDERGVLATQEILQLVRNAEKNTLVLCLISGGGSALMVAPASGITLEEKRITTNLLLRSGATIIELNAVRKHISEVKGGRLAEAAYPSPVMSLILSDVIGDSLDVIASGPTAADLSTYEEALQIIQKYELTGIIPASVSARLTMGAHGELPETPKQDAAIFREVRNIVIGSNTLAVEAAKRAADADGYTTSVLSTTLSGEAALVATNLAHTAMRAKQQIKAGEKLCLIAGGETTVTVRGSGRGGRNSELALVFGLNIQGEPGITCLSAGTDGVDGTSDAAGAVVDGATITRAATCGLDAAVYLKNNDSYSFFKELNDGLLVTGPTGTNVMDIQIILVDNS